MPGPRGFGWRKNVVQPERYAHQMIAQKRASLPELPPLDQPSLLPFRGRRIDQGQAGSCVAFATTRCLELGLGANDYEPILASPLQLYYDGRREEWAGFDPGKVPPLEDTGIEPRLMMRALEAQGYVPWDACPYTDDPVEINREPGPNVYTKAYDQRGLDWGVVTDVGLARTERVRQALCLRMPVMFGISVDQPFCENQGARITGIDHHVLGGHMLTVLAVLDEVLLAEIAGPLGLFDSVEPGDILFDNWWGTNWGTKDGYGVLSGALFGSYWVGDVTIFEAVPPVLMGAAR